MNLVGHNAQQADAPRVLVVDDDPVSRRALQRSLKRAGASGVDVLTFARVLPEDFLDGAGDPI